MDYQKVFRMCKKIDEINGLKAEDILQKYWYSNGYSYPVDIAKILYDMDIRVWPFDFSKIKDNSDSKILGAMVADDKNLALFYQTGETKNRNRFTLAHELAHCCLYHINENEMPYIEYRHEGNLDDQNEIEANIFAGDLLIPIRYLREVLSNNYLNKFPSSVKLAKTFAVSVNVMEERLKYLNIPFIDAYNRKIVPVCGE